jgi:DNA-directed RNA polymerase subunit RPC12/RpoP
METKYFKCSCLHCGGHIEFPVEMAGQLIDCPHCSHKMKLAAPGRAEASDSTPAEPQPCPTCGAPLPAGSDICPNCAGAPQKKGVLVWILALVVVCAAAAFFIWQKKSKSQATTKTSVPAPAPQSVAETVAPTNAVAQMKPKSLADLKAGDVTLEKAKDGNLVYAVGELKNDSDFQRFGIKIELDLLDAKGGKLGLATDYIQMLQPNENWHFRALITDPKTRKAVVGKIQEE